ncbi:SAM-dependent methyltransferase [Mycobacterium sp.]|uniref:SAM-dependent methyltransferase n=1 Tax=Mycobacterium sp. TaxID=1785 RepID=UPI003C75BD3F
MYSQSGDPWELGTRWYEQRKYAITLAMLPKDRYAHAFEPGCSVGVLTALLTQRCGRVTATDVAAAALANAERRLHGSGRRDQVTLLRQSVDEPWPPDPFDLLVLSEIGYYLPPDALRGILDRQCPRLAVGASVIAAHWRHPVDDYLMSGDQVNEVVAATTGLHLIGSYRDADVAIDVFDNADDASVAARTGVPT